MLLLFLVRFGYDPWLWLDRSRFLIYFSLPISALAPRCL